MIAKAKLNGKRHSRRSGKNFIEVHVENCCEHPWSRNFFWSSYRLLQKLPDLSFICSISWHAWNCSYRKNYVPVKPSAQIFQQFRQLRRPSQTNQHNWFVGLFTRSCIPSSPLLFTSLYIFRVTFLHIFIIKLTSWSTYSGTNLGWITKETSICWSESKSHHAAAIETNRYFFCDVRALFRFGFSVRWHLIKQMVFTIFEESSKCQTARWDMRDPKPGTTEEALTLTTKLDSFNPI